MDLIVALYKGKSLSRVQLETRLLSESTSFFNCRSGQKKRNVAWFRRNELSLHSWLQLSLRSEETTRRLVQRKGIVASFGRNEPCASIASVVASIAFIATIVAPVRKNESCLVQTKFDCRSGQKKRFVAWFGRYLNRRSGQKKRLVAPVKRNALSFVSEETFEPFVSSEPSGFGVDLQAF